MGHGVQLLYLVSRGGFCILAGQWHAQESEDRSCIAGC